MAVFDYILKVYNRSISSEARGYIRAAGSLLRQYQSRLFGAWLCADRGASVAMSITALYTFLVIAVVTSE